MIDAGRLEAFLCFAEHLSFTRAARQLHLSQPALHVQVRKLAEEIGAPLYERRGRALHLTAAGGRVLAFGRELQSQTRVFLAELHGEDPVQPVVLAAGEGALLHLLGPAIRRFVESSEAPLRVLTLDAAGCVEAVRTGRAHFAVAVLAGEQEELDTKLLLRSGAMVIAPPGHRFAGKRRVTLADLADERLVLPPSGRPHRVALERSFEAAGVRPEVAVEAGGWQLALHFVRLGLGVALINDVIGLPPDLVGRPVPELGTVSYFLLSRRGGRPSPAARTLRELVSESVKQR